MKVKLAKQLIDKIKKKKYYRRRVTIPKVFMDQTGWDNKEYLKLTFGFHTNGKPYLMLDEVEK